MSTQPTDAANKASSNNLNRPTSLYSLAGESAKRTLKQPYSWALAFSLLLGLMAVPPSAPAQTFSVLYSFKGGVDGNTPVGVVRDAAGNLYGTTLYGGDTHCFGSTGCGTVFKLDANGDKTDLYTFSQESEGENPGFGVVRDAAGNFYGTTLHGGSGCPGATGCGTVFKLDPSGNETVLHAFGKSGDGMSPGAGLVRDTQGNLYGTTSLGGTMSCGCGTIFKVDPSGKETVLYSFNNGTDGENPNGVIRDGAGNLYGTTVVGGANSGGTVFKLDPSGKLTVLHSFPGTGGNTPFGFLFRDAQGNLYGTTLYGGNSRGCQGLGCGTVFMLNPSGTKTVLYSFTGGEDGGFPNAGVIRDAAGNLYGTTQQGGNTTCLGASEHGCGVIFKLNPTGKETVLYSFQGKSDGQWPVGVIRDSAGNLYGAGVGGGAPSCLCGTVFKITP